MTMYVQVFAVEGNLVVGLKVANVLNVDHSSFVKNGQLFKLRYTYIDVCKDSTGALKCLELGGGLGQQAPFIHACE
jgi:hypothetical protein